MLMCSEKRSSYLGRKGLIFFTFSFVCAAAVVLSLFLVKNLKHKERDVERPAISRKEAKTSEKRAVEPSQPEGEICNTTDCIKIAASVADNMNPEADPCIDFAEFACGNFYKTATFNEGESKTGPFYTLQRKVNEIVKGQWTIFLSVPITRWFWREVD
ncbi:endothelin-converting enzyme 1 [Plakobranchus ocellatus]|uniref:Endothelin-converting enzyme 1 n=1 Tax=Plakobranchus ocellatus TaxID=259542 RepID=A0AAV4C0S7_9GAST|nr:endothelin-converting enzyme 1 [Plakobranchus ocellatus]